MKFRLFKILLINAFFISGCTRFQIVDLKPESFTSNIGKNKINIVVGIDTLRVVGGEYSDAKKWQQGLVDVLRNASVFKTVSYPYINKENIDLLIRGEVSGDFRHNGAKNFFTWWPGPLIFAHNWRGTRYIYDAYADVEVIDVFSGDVLGNYHAESNHELIHRSGNPGPMFSALLIIPGIIKGGMSASPRAKYRQQMYEVAYPNLWNKILQQIVEDQNKRYLARLDSQLEKCGEYIDEEPEVGQLWSDFNFCQTRKFRLLGQEAMESGTISVYLSRDRSIRVHVADDERILRWYLPKKRKRFRADFYQ